MNRPTLPPPPGMEPRERLVGSAANFRVERSGLLKLRGRYGARRLYPAGGWGASERR